MQQTIILVLAAFFSALSVNANACSYYIDQVAKSDELKAIAVAQIVPQTDRKILDANVLEFKFWESKSTPMCPDEMSYEADVDIIFEEKYADELARVCIGSLKVLKTENWNTNNENNYKITGLSSFRCYLESR